MNDDIMKNTSLYETGDKYLMHTYKRLPVIFTEARMQYLWDTEGNKYLDFIAGYGCLNVGHSNKYVVKALREQIGKIIQPSNIYYNIPQIMLAKKLCEISGFGEKVFFANSGTESIEGAIKLARKYSTDNYDSSRYEIITFKKAFHGRTLGALAATAQIEKQKLFEPLLAGFKYAELNNIESVKALLNENTCAIMLEPVQGEGGIYPADKKFIKNLRDICSEKNILLILDEIQTGFGRTGSMFAYENFEIKPDILVVAKSLGGGMPIGAIISTEEIAKSFSPGTHGSTFGGNAASCAAGLSVIDYIIKNNLAEKSKKLGKYLMDELLKIKNKYPVVKEIRGMGLMIGMEFNEPVAEKIVIDALGDKLVLNRVSDTILRFLPPLVITRENIDTLTGWLDAEIKEL
ncbi:MAG: aspartate aminotransferase family protein [Candidatus Humimicrobiaceae bacterium]|jgi:predicted acetylornithine/succinylornithine family transaminase|nr:aspartate aminotransferase family protein [Actinomycetota bacterium]MDY0027388.1 aspartate aminotransferase family protein [Candidatus Humimicrobiaceae bacterium]